MAEVVPLPSARRELFADDRGGGLRVSWHDERDVVVLSVWKHDRCAGTVRLPVADAARLATFLVARLGDRASRDDR